MQNNDDSLIKEMAKLLREGATMLDKSCPKCNTLIYRLPNGKIICPSCNSEIVIQKETTPPPQSQYSKGNQKTHDFFPSLNSIYDQINKLCDQMEKGSDIKKLEKILNLISHLLDLYERIARINT